MRADGSDFHFESKMKQRNLLRFFANRKKAHKKKVHYELLSQQLLSSVATAPDKHIRVLLLPQFCATLQNENQTYVCEA